MLFKPKFFLELGAEGEQQKPARVAPPAARPPAKAAGKASDGPAVAVAPSPAAAVAPPPSTSITTAEAIAAELAAAQADRPAPSLATFAPDRITPGGALPRRRRRGSADLGGFREMARSMMRS